MTPPATTRRRLLSGAAGSLGALAFRALLASEARAASPAAPSGAGQNGAGPHGIEAKAKRVLFLNMEGGPSAQETFDPKPAASVFKFARRGESGLAVSELFPELSKHADKLCLLRGMHGDSAEHISASIQLHCGKSLDSRPSVGSWVTYGLGSENADLPGFLILDPSKVGAGAKLYSSAFLPGRCAGTPIDRSLTVADAENPTADRPTSRVLLDRVQARHRGLLAGPRPDPNLQALVDSYELGFRMQTTLPGLLDVDRESRATLDAYGVNEQPTDRFGRQCLAARRLCEAGVRFVEVVHKSWDHHSQLATLLPKNCAETDRPIAALLADLSDRGLLDDTLVIWGGEFGRLKTATHAGGGSGHNNRGYTMWLAGGGAKPGFAYGATDDDGHEAVDGRVHTHDLHATVLHLLGLDHTKLTYRYAGRDFRLTDVHGRVVRPVLA